MPRTLTVNAASRAVMERLGLTYVRTFPTSMTEPAEGVGQGEVEFEITRKQWSARDSWSSSRNGSAPCASTHELPRTAQVRVALVVVRGRPSAGISAQGAREATNVWNCGRIPGSPSSDPRRIATSSPSGHSAPNRLEPQTEQKAFTRPPSGLKTRISSSPASRRNLNAECVPAFHRTRPSVSGSASSDSDWPRGRAPSPRSGRRRTGRNHGGGSRGLGSAGTSASGGLDLVTRRA